MRSKSFYKLRISLLNEVIARMYISFLQVSLQLVYCRLRKRSSSKIKPRYMRGMCVCEIRYHSCGPEFLLTS